ncbi:hypothetical protein O3G_MSEX005528 [Manduca sexta]|uniref:NEDD8 ultimate buster 1 n=1 Tax=Manduca sexta TaxID=7130 RepID=A0A921Z1B9_MANSE|nr:hypothetical protein O3G_MSEX005528 [Manduca sexta]
METNLQYEDLLIKLRAKLNEEKIKLWEPPYTQAENEIPQSLQDLARKFATELNMDSDSVLQALRELQLHSMERVRANEEYKETGLATFRVKAMLQGQKPMQMNIQKKLIAMATELISAVAVNVNIPDNRLKLIFNGKVIKPSMTLAEQGIKNGAQIMALIMAESPEEISKEDSRYRELKATLDDATLLSEYGVDIVGDEDYMKLEDQNGVAMELPPAERRSLMVGLALHERGRVAIRHKDFALALVLLLEADRQFSECRSSLLQSVDNWAVMQLDVCWCYERLRAVSSAADAALRLQRAAAAFSSTYGDNHHRLIAIKGNAESERILFMRLYLLQGIVAYHQNNREEAKRLFEKAEYEMNFLRVNEESVSCLMELGWSRAQARTALRATSGDVDRAHHHLDHQRQVRHQERERHRQEK